MLADSISMLVVSCMGFDGRILTLFGNKRIDKNNTILW